MKKAFLLTITLLLFTASFAAAQTVIILDYASDEYELEFKLPGDDTLYDIDTLYDAGIDIYSNGISEGSSIQTNGTYAEFYILDNNSILKLSRNTEFIIEKLEGSGGVNNFSLAGKLRMVAAKASGSKNEYNIRTESTVCGVRGTDFILDTIAGSAFLKNGGIDLENLSNGTKLSLNPGQGSNLFGDLFEAFAVTADAMAGLYQDMIFTNLDPALVPGYEGELPGNENDSDKNTDGAENPVDSASLEDGGDDPDPSDNAPKKDNPVMKFLKDALGFEIGSITINGTTYSKAVIQPEFTIGKLGLSLYLPVVYTNNLFDPNDWHQPNGNNEWSFGTDQNGWQDIVLDIFSDLFLKIKYVKWGDIRDDFFLKVGNLDDLTVGHGMFMYNYANDADFPVIRKVGLNLGIDFGAFGFEAVITDISNIDIFGGRIFFGDGFEFGISAILDIKPGALVNPSHPLITASGDPVFINAGIDVDIPIIENDTFSIVAFADLGAMVPYLRNDAVYDGETIEKGVKWESVFSVDAPFADMFHNFGVKAGVFGTLFGVNWNLEFRYYNGNFRPAFYNTTYDRVRGLYVDETLEYLASLNDIEQSQPDYSMGIFASTEFSILEMIDIELAYLWPWYMEEGKPVYGDDDYFHFQISIRPDVIPVLGIYGSIYYTRTSFIPTIIQKEGFEGFSLFDSNTIIGGEIVYPVSETLDIVGTVATTIQQENGEVVYDAVTGQPKIVPAIGIETRIHF